MSRWKPGDRVSIRRDFSLWPAGHPATVLDIAPGLLNGYDCAIRLDGTDGTSCFYDHELAEVKAP